MRVNIDRLNADQFFEVQDIVIKQTDSAKNIHCYPGILRGDNDCSENLYFTNDSLISFYKKALDEKGVSLRMYPKRVTVGCSANCINGHIIGADGAIYGCWEDLGIKDKQIGNILNNELFNETLFRQYIKSNLFNSPTCRSCGLLPVCSGGCAKKRYENKYLNGKHDLCSINKVNDSQALLDYLLDYYHLKKALEN